MTNFHRVLINTVVANFATAFLWFGWSFWVYLETRSVLINAIISGSYMALLSITSIFFGGLVDRFKKKQVMIASSVITSAAFLGAGALFLALPKERIIDLGGVWFWLIGGLVLGGAVVENMRNIALSTTVTLLVPDGERDRANGLVGAAQGLAFMATSIFAGLAIGLLGMGWTALLAIVATVLALVHLVFVAIPEKGVFHDPANRPKAFDLAGSWSAIRAVPGLMALIFFSCFNNFVGGLMMALLDPYGLTLFSVELWGVVLGVTSAGFIIGGLVIARRGLGANPLRTLLLVNVVVSIVGMTFVIREWHWLLVVGIFAYMCLIPAAEAAEQTIIQRVVPLPRQGRVFGFATSVETAATPISALAIGPIAEFWLIPWVDSPAGEATWGWLLGEGDARGIALVFILSAALMLVVVLLAFRTRAYAGLSRFYADSAPVQGAPSQAEQR
ncbi:MFS transporter [Ammonicoccus fulvus]|uniref:MFS transporter n=1 Tax=Ammonicoccus fulvus TaxID=3138240 RepID=A0ABZ3FLR0_9ACTN